MADFFGFEINRKSKEPVRPSFVPRVDTDDGAGVIQAGGHFGAYIDLDGDKVKSEVELIFKYRDIAAQPECDQAIEDIVGESIVGNHEESPVKIVLEGLKVSNNIKDSVIKEFKSILSLLGFNQYAHEIFRKWYVDGRLPYHIIIDTDNPKQGIKELRYIDPTKLRKVKEVEEEADPKTGAKLIKKVDEYFVFQDNMMGKYNEGVKIYPDAIAYCTSGVMDPQRKRILSYLHKALKPVNQLRMMEDSLVIYRISRAPERRIFYIDIGNLPKGKAEEYLRGIMNQYRNKLVYDAKTGDIKDDKKHMSMLEDFLLPRREGGKGTEITTLPAGQNLGELEDVKYFRNKLLQALNVPISRLEPQQGGMIGLGRSTEVTRDEVKFGKFITRLRNKFSQVFDQALKIQLVMKGICSLEEWKMFQEQIYYDYLKDNNFTELREAELLRERVGLLNIVDPYIGRYYSTEWVKKNVLQMSNDEVDQMEKEIEDEQESGISFGQTEADPNQFPPE